VNVNLLDYLYMCVCVYLAIIWGGKNQYHCKTYYNLITQYGRGLTENIYY